MTAPPTVPFPGYAYDYGSDLQFVKDNETGLVIWTKPNQTGSAEGSNMKRGGAGCRKIRASWVFPSISTRANDWPMSVALPTATATRRSSKCRSFMGGFYGIGQMSGASGRDLLAFRGRGRCACWERFSTQSSASRAIPTSSAGWSRMARHRRRPRRMFCEYGPVADKSMRQFLQERYGSLAAVSKRWHGDASHYKSWDDVHAPEIAEFAGFGPHAIDLRGTWRVKYVTGPDGNAACAGSGGMVSAGL